MNYENYTELHEFLVSILGSVPYGIIAMDMEGKVIACNSHALNSLGIAQKNTEVIETALIDYLEDLPTIKELIVACLTQDRKPFDIVGMLINNKSLTFKGRRILQGMLFTIEDITQQEEQKRTNLLAMIQGQETERRRLAREIHDGVGPTLSTLKLHLEGIKEGSNGQADKKLDKMEQLLQSVSSDLRSISHALMPRALLDFGLVPALQNLCNRITESGQLDIEFFHSGSQQRLSEEIELNLFRISQELLNNAIKYAKASTITVQLIQHPFSIILSVEDDGVGFDPQQLPTLLNKGIGLQNIETRAETLAGSLYIETQLGRGVLTTVELPIKN